MSEISNKALFIFRDSEDKNVYISLPKVKNFTTEVADDLDTIADVILAHKACLDLDIVYLKSISHISENSSHVIEDGEIVD